MGATIILKRNEYPEWLKVPEVRGVCFGDCIMDHVWQKTELAHAHLGPWPFKYRRWICFRFQSTVTNKMAGLHELAHILNDGERKYGHGKKWRRKLISLGGSLDSSYLSGSIGGKHFYMPGYHHKDCPRKHSIREQCKCV